MAVFIVSGFFVPRKGVITMKNSSKTNIRNLAVTAVMAAIGAVLMFIELSLPIIPSFIKLDFSELPALVTSFALGPIYGVLVCLIKNVVHLFVTNSAGIGELANFLMGAVFVFTAGIIYKKKKTRVSALIACIIGAFLMGLISLPINYYITYPFYTRVFFGGDANIIIAMYKAIFSEVENLWQCLMVFNFPFTFAKGIIDSLICFIIYKRISPLLKNKV